MIELTKEELLIEKLVKELNEVYSSEKNLPESTADKVDLLSSKIEYNKYMNKYMELTGDDEDTFDQLFLDLVISEVIH